MQNEFKRMNKKRSAAYSHKIIARYNETRRQNKTGCLSYATRTYIINIDFVVYIISHLFCHFFSSSTSLFAFLLHLPSSPLPSLLVLSIEITPNYILVKPHRRSLHEKKKAINKNQIKAAFIASFRFSTYYVRSKKGVGNKKTKKKRSRRTCFVVFALSGFVFSFHHPPVVSVTYLVLYEK